MADATPVIIEAAINGGTPRTVNLHVPRTPDEIAADALRCLEAGAAVIHNHNDDAVIGGAGRHATEPYATAWRAIRERRPDVILYPTMASGGPHTNVEERYAHVVDLAEAGLLTLGLVDPGTTNLGGADEDGLPRPVDTVYLNTYRDARYMIETCARLRVGMSISIFEPGFLRVVLAYHQAARLPAGSFVKLYFGARPLSFGLPPTLPSLEAYLAMLEGTGLPWLVSAIGGDVVGCGLARHALERGGHVQVGLEPFAGPRTPTNVQLIEEAKAVAAEVGRPVATCAEAKEILGVPRR
ncbi:MAG: 3-keto-5-aminohexanoate cleavage protein [Chloroflexi bacterium]|nr:3-keto-5-aminohexanoate cleavage protein [Chloroflexota bacterium]MDA1002622.1 3-keto-5-aminohexanoate cleavage protein [Chloroflexota bacterium]